MLTKDIIAIIPAAGQGLRFGGSRSKLLAFVAGKAVIVHTIEAFKEVAEVAQIIIACRAEDENVLRSLLSPYPDIVYVEGGATRSASVKNALNFVEQHLPVDAGDCFVAVHDGARCCVSIELIEKAITAARKHRAVSIGMPLSDSIKEVDENCRVVQSKPREMLWTVQTPQVFQFPLLWNAHQTGDQRCTDDAGLVEIWHPVYMVEGERTNIKITTQEDMKLAELYLLSRMGVGNSI